MEEGIQSLPLFLRKMQHRFTICTKFANFADFAIHPPKWQAGRSRDGAELAFCVGGRLAQSRRNDTTSADGSAVAAAVKFVHVAAVVAFGKIAICAKFATP
jgi:hypothetical protein